MAILYNETFQLWCLAFQTEWSSLVISLLFSLLALEFGSVKHTDLMRLYRYACDAAASYFCSSSLQICFGGMKNNISEISPSRGRMQVPGVDIILLFSQTTESPSHLAATYQ